MKRWFLDLFNTLNTIVGFVKGSDVVGGRQFIDFAASLYLVLRVI